MSGAEQATGPVLQFSKAQPSDDELAAVVTALAAIASGGGPIADDGLGDRPRAGGWKSYYRVMRRMHPPGRDAWKAAYWR